VPNAPDSNREAKVMEEETVAGTVHGIVVGVCAGVLLWVALFFVVL
jgi:hypothetical protein